MAKREVWPLCPLRRAPCFDARRRLVAVGNGGKVERWEGGGILLVPIGGERNPKEKVEASSWSRSGATVVETDVELGRTLPSFMVEFFEEILAQGRR